MCPSHEVAGAAGIPARFSLRALKPLVTRRILYALRGPHGGYRLAKPVSRIAVLDVLQSVEGPMLRLTDPGENKSGVGRGLADAFGEAAKATRKVLSRVTVADLAGGKKGK